MFFFFFEKMFAFFVWRQTKSATCEDSCDNCFSLDLGAVTTRHDKRGFIDSQR